MTNKAISAILEHLSNEARNSVHATFGIVELVRDVVDDPMVRTSVALGRAGADQLLRSLDDVRDLLSSAPYASAALEQFDLVGSVSEIVEMLNLASGKLAKRILLEGCFDRWRQFSARFFASVSTSQVNRFLLVPFMPIFTCCSCKACSSSF